MNKYNPQKFITRLEEKISGKSLSCPYCMGNQFTTTEDFATILIGKDLSSLNIGPSIPTGMLICQKCGHVSFFALGALGFLDDKGNNDEKQ